jgi:hypothetical protein
VTLDNGQVVAVKLDAPHDDGRVTREATVMQLLHGRGVPVPDVLAIGTTGASARIVDARACAGFQPKAALAKPHLLRQYLQSRTGPTVARSIIPRSGPTVRAWMATGWAGDVTLDAALQRATPLDARDLGLRLVTSLGMVEAALVTSSGDMTPSTALTRARALLAPWVGVLPAAFSWLDVPPSIIDRAVVCARSAVASSLTVGLLDYHAGNVIVPDAVTAVSGYGPDPLVMVDVGNIGWDWPARRVAQCAIATGVSSATGTFRSALDREVISAAGHTLAIVHGGNAEEWVGAVIAHALVLLATAAAHLRAVASGEAHPARAHAWADVAGRRSALYHAVQALMACA